MEIVLRSESVALLGHVALFTQRASRTAVHRGNDAARVSGTDVGDRAGERAGRPGGEDAFELGGPSTVTRSQERWVR